MRTTTGQCDSCQLLRINGIVCHESGCPEAWRDDRRECRECGAKYNPTYRGERECSHRCSVIYSGAFCDCGACS